jgi:hypothetical protein
LVDKFLSQNKIGIPVYLFEQELPTPLSIQGVPTAYIIAADGKLVYMHTGALNWDDNGAKAHVLDLAAQVSK